MPPRTNEFQQLVTAIETQLAPHGATVTESRMLPERGTGEPREVDIAVSANVGAHPVLIGVECRGGSGRRHGKQWVDQVIGKYADLPVDRVVMVSQTGFTRGAEAKAKEHNITTVTLAEAVDAKCIPAHQPREIDVTSSRIHYDGGNIHPANPIDPDAFGAVKAANVLDKDGNLIGNVEKFILAQLSRPEIAAKAKAYDDLPGTYPLDTMQLMVPPNDVKSIVGADGIPHRIEFIDARVSVRVVSTKMILQPYEYMGIGLLIGRATLHEHELRVLVSYDGSEETRVGLTFTPVVEKDAEVSAT